MWQKRNKFRNQPTVVDGIRFHSKKEAARWQQLAILERTRKISGLERQKKFRLEVNGILIASYICDFVYVEDGETIVEDCKGYRTRDYLLKKKLMSAIHGIEIRET